MQDAIAALRAAPERIRNAQLALFATMEAEVKLKRDVDRKRAVVRGQVAAELDDAGKPRFGNEAKREAETETRLDQDAPFARLVATAEEATRAVQRARVELDFEQNLFASARALARIAGGAD